MLMSPAFWLRRFTLAATALLFVSVALAAQQPVETATVASRKKLSLTVYNSGMALVRDTRQVNLPQGEVRLRLAGVAERAEPDTVQIVYVTAPHDLDVIEQSYAYNPVTFPKLLDAYVGKTITVVRPHWRNRGEVTEDRVQAKLLAANPPVWEINGQIVTGLESHHYIFPSLPPGFDSEPTFTFLLDNHSSGPQTVEASYLTNGMSWSADYVLSVSQGGKIANLTGWVTLKNESGASYPDAALQLIAGQVQRVYPPGVGGGIGSGIGARSEMVMAAQAPAPQFVQQPFSAYHLYTLARHATLPDKESKQIRLLGASGVHITRTYEVNGQTYYYRNPEPGAPRHDPVEMHVKFENSKANSLGMPLPEGIVRVYQTDSAGLEQLIGEANIQHTPKGETLNLNVGSAFDVVEERKQTDYKRLSAHSAESSYEITLRNHQSQPIQVEVNEPFQGDWQILNSNFPYEKTSAFSARFKVPVKAGGTAVLKYRLEVRWE